MKTVTKLALSQAATALEMAAKLLRQETDEMIGSGDIIPLIRHYAELRDDNDVIKKLYDALDSIEDSLSHKDVPDAFKRIGIKTINIDEIGRVTVAYKWACSIADGKKPEAFTWLRDGGNGGIIIETINAQTLASFAKTEVENRGKELPTDLFTTSLRPYTSITKT